MERRIGKSLDQRFGVCVQILPRRGDDGGSGLFAHELLGEQTDRGIADGLVDKGVAVRQSDIGEQRMRAVQHPELGSFIGPDIGDKLGSDLVPSRTPVCEAIFNHPLAERFGKDRSFISQAFKRLGNRIAIVCRRGGNNTVDHGRRASTSRLEPCQQRRIAALQVFAHKPCQLLSIFGEVVAAHQRQTGQPSIMASAQPLLEVVVHALVTRQREIEAAVRSAAIAFFGDGEADEARGGRSKRGGHCLRFIGRDQDVPDRADDPRACSFARAFGDGVKSLLRIHLVCHFARSQRDAGDCPVPIACRHGAIRVPGLMRAVECADAEVDDTCRLRPTVIGKAGGVARRKSCESERIEAQVSHSR